MRTWAALAVLALVAGGCMAAADAEPRCSTGGERTLVLFAQAVPEATYLPCVGTPPEGWGTLDLEISRGSARHVLHVEGMSAGTITVSLLPRCSVSGATAHPSAPNGPQRFDRNEGVPGRYVATRMYVFDGGCVSQRFDVPSSDRAVVLRRAATALGLTPTERVLHWYAEEHDLELLPG